MAGGGLGVELLEGNADGRQGVGDFFEEGQHAARVAGHLGPGVVGYRGEIPGFTGGGIGIGTEEDDFDFEAAGNGDAVVGVQFINDVLECGPRTALEGLVVLGSPKGHDGGVFGVEADVRAEAGQVGFHVELAGCCAFGGHGVVLQHPEDAETDSDATLLAHDLGEFENGEDP